jgi:tetratricopeptide (TPR) repeat protein
MPNHEKPASRSGPVGANIFRLRRKLRITQKQLAAPEFSISYISAIERGRIRPSLKALEILAQRLNVASAELLADIPDGFAPEDETGEAAPPSLITLLSQRPSSNIILLTLCWASMSLARHNPHYAAELLDSLSLNIISDEQRLLLHYFRGTIALTTHRPADAQAMAESAFQQAEFSGHTELLERCRFLLARAYEAQEKFLPAFETFTACVQAIEKGTIADPLFAIDVYSALGEHHRRRERRDAAVACYQQALSYLDSVLNLTGLAESSAQISQSHMENIHSTLADWYAGRSRAFTELAEARQRIAQAASNLGLTFQELGNPEAAEQQLRQAIDLCEQLGTRSQAILARIALADLLLDRQQPQEAESLALEAQTLCQPNEQGEAENAALYGRVLVTLGDVNRTLNRLDESDQCFQQAIALLKQQNANEQLSQAYYRYSTLLHQKGLDAESYEMVTQAYLLNQRGSQAGG